jgi:hypothetical protein
MPADVTLALDLTPQQVDLLSRGLARVQPLAALTRSRSDFASNPKQAGGPMAPRIGSGPRLASRTAPPLDRNRSVRD